MFDIDNLSREDRKAILDKFGETNIGKLFRDYEYLYESFMLLYGEYEHKDWASSSLDKKLNEAEKKYEAARSKLLNSLITLTILS